MAAEEELEPEGPTGQHPATRRRPRPYHRHGLTTLKRAITELGSRAVDGRTQLGRALNEWRKDLIADVGGPGAVSTQQAALIDLTVRTKLLVDSVDVYVLSMDSPVNKRRRSLYPVVRERQALVNQLQSLLRDLGLERRTKAAPDLAAYIAAKTGAACEGTGPEGGTTTDGGR